MSDADQNVLQGLARPGRVMDVVAGHVAQAHLTGQGDQAVHQGIIVWQQMVLEFEPEVLRAEQIAVAVGRGQGRLPVLPQERRGDF